MTSRTSCILFLYFLTLQQHNNNAESRAPFDLSDRGNNKDAVVISHDASALLFTSVDSPLLHNCCKVINND